MGLLTERSFSRACPCPRGRPRSGRPVVRRADGRRDDHHAAQPHPDDARRAIAAVALAGRLLAGAILVLVPQREGARLVVAVPLVVVRQAVVLPEPALLVGAELAVGIDARRVLHLLLLQRDADPALAGGVRVGARPERVAE